MHMKSCIFKKIIKIWHNRHIPCCIFRSFDKVLLNDSQLNLFLEKLNSRWTKLFIVKTIYPHDIIDIENPKNGHMFKVNENHLNHYLKFLEHIEESQDLVDRMTSPRFNDYALYIMFFLLY